MNGWLARALALSLVAALPLVGCNRGRGEGVEARVDTQGAEVEVDTSPERDADVVDDLETVEEEIIRDSDGPFE